MEVKTYPQSGNIDRKILRLVSFYFLSEYLCINLIHRRRYEEAKAQIKKGEKLFEKVLKSVTNLRDWSYVGLVCFTEIENRGVFMSELEDLRQDEIKVSQNTSNSTKCLSSIYS